MSNNHDRLNQLILRTMLLEGGSGEKILNDARAYAKSGKTVEDKTEMTKEIRKEVSKNAKELMSEEQLSAFIDELTAGM